jgi:hypothetical protein
MIVHLFCSLVIKLTSLLAVLIHESISRVFLFCSLIAVLSYFIITIFALSILLFGVNLKTIYHRIFTKVHF